MIKIYIKKNLGAHSNRCVERTTLRYIAKEGPRVI
jgi:hypothetical protein